MLVGGLSKHRLQDMVSTEAAQKERKENRDKAVQRYCEESDHESLQIQDEDKAVNMLLKKK